MFKKVQEFVSSQSFRCCLFVCVCNIDLTEYLRETFLLFITFFLEHNYIRDVLEYPMNIGYKD
jgi:hypothetical protein